MERDRAAAEHNEEQHFKTLHQVDTISRKAAATFLQRNLEQWQAKDHPRGTFTVDLMEPPSGHNLQPEFYWPHYLNSTPWGRQIVFDVTALHVVWFSQKQRPGFWMSLRSGGHGTVDAMSPGHCVAKWNDEADEVAWR